MTDSKYLALLGLDGQTSTISVLPKPQNVTIVTIIRPGNELDIYGFIKNVTHFLPTHNIAIYGVALNDDALQNLKANCNSTKCNVIQFDLAPFPNHAEDDRLHVFRPLVIQVKAI